MSHKTIEESYTGERINYFEEGLRLEKARLGSETYTSRLDKALSGLLQPHVLENKAKVIEILKECYPSPFPVDEIDDLMGRIEKTPDQARQILAEYFTRKGYESYHRN